MLPSSLRPGAPSLSRARPHGTWLPDGADLRASVLGGARLEPLAQPAQSMPEVVAAGLAVLRPRLAPNAIRLACSASSRSLPAGVRPTTTERRSVGWVRRLTRLAPLQSARQTGADRTLIPAISSQPPDVISAIRTGTVANVTNIAVWGKIRLGSQAAKYSMVANIPHADRIRGM